MEIDKEKLAYIKHLLCDLYDNYVDLDDALLTKYENSIIPKEEYLNDIALLKYWNNTIREFLDIRENQMAISKERAEELRNRLIVNLRTKCDEILNYAIEEAGKDPIKFLFNYIALIKKDYRASNGRSSSIGYFSVDFPLSIREFTEEELKYFKFYEE